MTTIDLYRKHKAGEVSREKFLYEVRRDNNLPFITNLTSYDDAVKILKNKGIVTEVDTKEAKADEAVKAEVKAKAPSTKKPSSLHIDVANPYEYRHGLQYELNELGEYTDEALEKAKTTVLKNLAKDANFYSNLLNQKQSHYEFKASETDKPGMQAKADGYLKKELKKDEKSNVKDNLGKKEEGTAKPKGVKIMPDKGVTGSEKTIKEGLEVKKYDDEIEISADSGDYSGFIEDDGTVSFSVVYDDEDDRDGMEFDENNWKDILGADHAFVKIIDSIGGKVEAIDDYVQITVDTNKLLGSNIKEGLEELKKKVINKYVTVEIEDDGEEYPMLNKTAVANYLKSVIDPSELKSVNVFMRDDEGFDESSSYFFEDNYVDTTEQEVEDWAKQEMSYYLFSKPDEFPGKDLEEEFRPGVDLGASFSKFKGMTDAEDQFEDLMRDYDWYYEMSDDPRIYNRGQEVDQKLKSLVKTVGNDRAVELFNQYAPSDRKVTTSFFMEGKEDKHAKLKEALKAALKKKVTSEDKISDENAKKSAIQTEKAKLLALNKQKQELQADTTKVPAVKTSEKTALDLKIRAATDSLNKLNQGKISVV